MSKFEEKVRCNFCGRGQDEVRRIISGKKGAYICDECIEICQELLGEEAMDEENFLPDEYYNDPAEGLEINLPDPCNQIAPVLKITK